MTVVESTNTDAARRRTKPRSLVPTGEELKMFTATTTIHGVRHLSKSHKFRSAVWVGLLLLGGFMLIIQGHSQILLYLDRPIATHVDLSYPKSIAFPTVYFCNINQFRISTMTKEVYEILRDIDRGVDADLSKLNETLGNSSSLEFLLRSAHRISDMIIKCKLPDGQECQLDNFTTVATDFGICIAFNVVDNLRVSLDGAQHGLRILFNLETYEHVEATSNTIGVKMLLSPNRAIPLVAQNGIEIAPGYMTQIGLNPTEHMELLERDGGTCQQMEMLEHFTPSDYSEGACRLDRSITNHLVHCGCLPTSVAQLNDANLTERICTVRKFLNCVTRVPLKPDDCVENCTTTSYRLTFSFSQLPGNVMRRLLVDEVASAIDVAFRKGNNARARFQADILEEFARLHNNLLAAQGRLEKMRLIPNVHVFLTTFTRLQQLVPCYLNFTTEYGELLKADPFSERHWFDIPTWRVAEVIYEQSYFDICGATERAKFTRKKEMELLDWLKPAWEALRAIGITLDMFNEERFTMELSATQRQHARVMQLIDKYLTTANYTKLQFATDWQRELSENAYEQEFMDQFISEVRSNLDRIVESIQTVYDGEKLVGTPSAETQRLTEYGRNETLLLLVETIAFGEQYDCEPSDEPDEHNPGCGRQEPCRYKMFERNPKLQAVRIGPLLQAAYGCISHGGLFVKARNLSRQLEAAADDYVSAFQDMEEHLSDYRRSFHWRTNDAFYRENIAGVNIYFRELKIETYRQSLAYGPYSLLCDIGGTLGLFLGASLLSVFEIIDFLIFRYTDGNFQTDAKQ